MTNIATPLKSLAKEPGVVSRLFNNLTNNFFSPQTFKGAPLNVKGKPGIKTANQQITAPSKFTASATLGAAGITSLFGNDNNAEATGFTDEQLAVQDIFNDADLARDPSGISGYLARALSLNNISPQALNETDAESFSPPSYQELDEGGFGAILQGLTSAQPVDSPNGGTRFTGFLSQVANQGDENAKANYENARKVFDDTLNLRKIVNDEKNLDLQARISASNANLQAASIQASSQASQALASKEKRANLSAEVFGTLTPEQRQSITELNAQGFPPEFINAHILQLAQENAYTPTQVTDSSYRNKNEAKAENLFRALQGDFPKAKRQEITKELKQTLNNLKAGGSDFFESALDTIGEPPATPLDAGAGARDFGTRAFKKNQNKKFNRYNDKINEINRNATSQSSTASAPSNPNTTDYETEAFNQLNSSTGSNAAPGLQEKPNSRVPFPTYRGVTPQDKELSERTKRYFELEEGVRNARERR